MRSTIAKTVLLLLLTGSLVAVAWNLSCRGPEAHLKNLGIDPTTTTLNKDNPPELMFLRTRAKERLTQDLIANRRSLWETAALFRALNQLPPGVPSVRDPDHPVIRYRPRTDEEEMCVQVIYFVHAAAKEPARARAEALRLESELREELRKSGAIRLPDPSTLTPAEHLIEEARAAWQAGLIPSR